MSTTATIFGSSPTPGDRGAAALQVYAAVAPLFDSFARDGAEQDEPSVGPTSTSAISNWLDHIQQAFDRWTESNARSRADAALREIARSARASCPTLCTPASATTASKTS